MSPGHAFFYALGAVSLVALLITWLEDLPLAGRGEARKQEDAALIGLLGSDMRWFKLRFDEIANLLRAGRVEDAFVLASGCASFKRSFHPAKDEAATTAWLKEDDVKRRAFWRNEQAVRVPGSTEP